jgi:hypothetical protein
MRPAGEVAIRHPCIPEESAPIATGEPVASQGKQIPIALALFVAPTNDTQGASCETEICADDAESCRNPIKSQLLYHDWRGLKFAFELLGESVSSGRLSQTGEVPQDGPKANTRPIKPPTSSDSYLALVLQVER